MSTMKQQLAPLRARWDTLAPREKVMVAVAAGAIAIAIVWMIAFAPALSTLRAADAQRATLDAQLQRMMGLQAQAQSLQALPKQNPDEALRLLELSVRQRLGAGARINVNGERVTLTLAGISPDALAQWLTQARANAHVTPGEAHLTRNASGTWDGTLALMLPAR